MRMRKISFIISSVIIIFITIPVFSAPPVVIDDDLGKLRFGTSMDYLRDDSGKLTIEDIVSGSHEWTEAEKDNFNFGFNPPPYWFRFTVDNRQRTGRGWYFEIDYGLIDYVDLYSPAADGTYREFKTGDRNPFAQRDVVDRNFVFHLDPGPGMHTYYVRFKTASSLNFTPLMWSTGEYIKRINIEFPVFWMYFGLMLVMAIYNLFLFISVRESTYIFYSLFIVTFILFQSTLNGFAFQYLWPNQVWWANNCLPFFMLNSVVTCGPLYRPLHRDKKNQADGPPVHNIRNPAPAVPA